MDLLSLLGFLFFMLAISSPVIIITVLIMFGKDMWLNRYALAFWKTAYIGDKFYLKDDAWSVIEIIDRKDKYAKFVKIKENGERHTYESTIAIKELFLHYTKERK